MQRFNIPPAAPKQARPAPPMPGNPFEGNEALKEFHCRNKQCKKPVALTDGIRLYVAGMVIAQRTGFTCAHCGFSSEWRPVLAPVKTSIK